MATKPRRKPNPPPSTPLRTGYKAGFVTRALATLIDMTLILLLAGTAYLLAAGTLRLMHIDMTSCRAFVPVKDFSSLVHNLCRLTRMGAIVASLAIGPIYLFSFWLFGGRTVGMAIMGLRVVRVNGGRLLLVTALVRVLAFGLSLLTLGLGFLWAIFDNDRQALHDKIARTYVIYWNEQQVKSAADYGAHVYVPHPPPLPQPILPPSGVPQPGSAPPGEPGVRRPITGSPAAADDVTPLSKSV